MTTVVYKYGLLAPTKNKDAVMKQMLTAHRYRNALVSVEKNYRQQLRCIHAKNKAVIDANVKFELAKNKLAEVEKEINKTRQDNRKRAETKDMKELRTQALLSVKTAKKELFEARKATKEDASIKIEIDTIVTNKNDFVKVLRKWCSKNVDLYWGTYNLVEDAMMRSAKSMPLYDGAEINDPRFLRWDGTGRIGIQIQREAGSTPLYSKDIFNDLSSSDDKKIEIVPVDELAWHSESRAERRKKSRTVLRFRVGSTKTREPIVAEFPMIMHRPLPVGAEIKNATVNLNRYGNKEEWTLCITVKLSDHLRSNCHGKGVVGADVCWRNVEEEKRAIMCYGEGEFTEFRVSDYVVNGIKKFNSLKSLRDEKFNVALANYVKWVKARSDVPEWMNPVGLHQWRSKARLANLCSRWKDNRIANDETAFAALEAWRYRDQHLFNYEYGVRRSTLRHRKEQYRIFASQLAKRYKTLAIEKKFLKAFSVRKKENSDVVTGNRNPNRFNVSVSELILVLKNAFISRGGEVIEVDAKNTTKQHHKCGFVNDKTSKMKFTCGGCGEEMDRDENASMNIFERGCDAVNTVTARES